MIFSLGLIAFNFVFKVENMQKLPLFKLWHQKNEKGEFRLEIVPLPGKFENFLLTLMHRNLKKMTSYASLV